MTLTRWVRMAVLVNLATAWGGFSSATAREMQPNILLILIDDLGWMDLGCQGSAFYRTPHIDRLAAEGMRFTDAYASQCVCSPTRAAILTGQSPARLHLTTHIPGRESGAHFVPDEARFLPAESRLELPLDHVTLAERLRTAGYSTGFIGKWHLAGTGFPNGIGRPEFYPEHQGFDVNLGGCALGLPPSHYEPYGIPNLAERRSGEYLTKRLTDEAISFIGARRTRPFFLALWHYAVHTPIQASADVVAKYRDMEAKGLRNATYAGMIELLDSEVGRLLFALDDAGLTDDTIVLFTSDNGGYLEVTDNHPLRSGKGHLYEGGLRVPLVVRWPGHISPGAVESEPVISHDLYPTLLDVGGCKDHVDQSLDGISLLPLLTSSAKLKRRALYFHYPNYSNGGNRLAGAIRFDRWKLIEFFDDNSLELYDLSVDIGERTNLANSFPEKAHNLRHALQEWREHVGALMPSSR